jgi:gamma-glutamyltranspeptidase/glutathione hydrolase
MVMIPFLKSGRERRRGGCGGQTPRRRATAAALALSAALSAGCSALDTGITPREQIVTGFFGGVAVDEPRAALIGRDVLQIGGSAADAATAVYFALSVTMPSAASLGGGGLCVYFDSESGTVEALDFLTRPPASVPPGTPRPNGVPGNPRGFFALHAKYGVLRWNELLRPSLQLARFGTQVSRAFARQLDAARDDLESGPEIARVFARPSGGGLVREGDFLEQVDLATVLGRILSKGPGDFYSGQLAHQLVDAAAAAGGYLSIDDLRAYVPRWRPTVAFEQTNWTAHFAPPPALAGTVGHAMLAMLEDAGYGDAEPDEQAHLMAETAMRAFADRAGWSGDLSQPAAQPEALSDPARYDALMASYAEDRHTVADALTPRPNTPFENASATTFIAVDAYGSAAACAISMNSLFGTGRMAPGMGLFLAAPEGEGRGPSPLGPVIVMNGFTNQLFFAGAASGGLAAPTALTGVLARTLLAGEPMDSAIAQPRVHHHGLPDVTYVEEALSPDIVEALETRTHTVRKTPVLGRVNALICPNGLTRESESCQVAADPRGPGLAAAAEPEE